VELLLENGANASAQGGLLGTGITAAVYGNSSIILEKLMKRGVDPHAKGGKYGCCLQAAAVKADIEILDDLLNRAIELVNYREGKYHTALIAASYFNRIDVVNKLLDAGAEFRFQGGVYRSAIAAAAIRGNKSVLDKLLDMKPPDRLLDEALVEACVYRQSACVEALLKAGANVYTTLSPLGTASEALSAPEPEDNNSDVDENEAGEEEDDEDDDEDDDDSSNEDWEGDNVSVSGNTDDCSVTDLQLEEELTEEERIHKLLKDAEARCKRNPTVKRFRTLKYRELPKSLSIGAPSPPPVPSMPLFTSQNPPGQDPSSIETGYGQHREEPWSLPFRSESHEYQPNPQNGQSQRTSMTQGYGSYPIPSFAHQRAHSPQRIQSPETHSQRQYHGPPPLPTRQDSGGSISGVFQSFTPAEPSSRKGSEDRGLKRQSKALGRKPVPHTGINQQQQQTTAIPRQNDLRR